MINPMTKLEAKKKIDAAQQLVFEIEEKLAVIKFNDPDYLRQEGYRLRIAMGNFLQNIKDNCLDEDISKRLN